MVGFIFMVDAFEPDNGPTRFLPGSHGQADVRLEGRTVLACGSAGSMIVYNGSVWHGHAANVSNRPRRSIQGAYIPRNAKSGFDLKGRLSPETLGRLDALSKLVLGI